MSITLQWPSASLFIDPSLPGLFGISVQISEKGGMTVGLCLVNISRILKPLFMEYFRNMSLGKLS